MESVEINSFIALPKGRSGSGWGVEIWPTTNRHCSFDCRSFIKTSMYSERSFADKLA